MNIEESIRELKGYLTWLEANGFSKLAKDSAIETLLTAYEKEKGENVKLRLQDIPLIEGELKAYKDRVNELKAELEKEKEKNKELEKMLSLKSHKRRYNTMNYIKKNKLNKFDTVGICQDMRAFKRTGEIKYRAYITFQNKQYTLGTYTDLDKAKEARRKGEIMVENIKKNFVEKIKGEE